MFPTLMMMDSVAQVGVGRPLRQLSGTWREHTDIDKNDRHAMTRVTGLEERSLGTGEQSFVLSRAVDGGDVQG